MTQGLWQSYWQLNNIQKRLSAETTLYVTPGGVTGGPDTLIDEMILAAGLSNFQEEAGWHSLPLEKIAYQQPKYVATAFYGVETNHSNFWSAARHPLIRNQLANQTKISLDGATTSCGGWFLLDAIEKLANGESAHSQLQILSCSISQREEDYGNSIYANIRSKRFAQRCRGAGALAFLDARRDSRDPKIPRHSVG